MEVRREDLANWALRTSPKFTTEVKISIPSGFLTRSEIRKSQSPFAPLLKYIILQYIIYAFSFKFSTRWNR